MFCCESAKTGKTGEKSPNTTGVVRCRSLGNRCKVVSRANHNSRAPESKFVVSLAAPETTDKQKLYNFGSFGLSRAHSKKYSRANPRLHERAIALSFSVFVVKTTCGGVNHL